MNAHEEILRRHHSYFDTLKRVENKNFIEHVKIELSRAPLGRHVVEQIEYYGIEIVLWDETKDSRLYGKDTLAFVCPSEESKLNLIYKSDESLRNYAGAIAHDFRHTIEGLLSPAVIMDVGSVTQTNERLSVDRFIAMRLTEAAAYAFDGIVDYQFDNPDYEATKEKFLIRFINMLDQSDILDQYDPLYMNSDMANVVMEGRLPAMISSSHLINRDVIGSLLRLSEHHENALAKRSALDWEIDQAMIIDKLSHVELPKAEIAAPTRESIKHSRNKTPMGVHT